MKPLFAAAKEEPRRVVYAEGEDERVLRAVQAVVEDGIAKPILIGRPSVVEARLKRFGLSMAIGREFDLINPEDDPRYRDYVATYWKPRDARGSRPTPPARWCARTRR
jgi:malate dehydrogenase (oxaloacetate-decarboxylating)(NADP+)